MHESFRQNRGSGKYCVDLSCMKNFVFQPDEIRFRFLQVKSFPVTLSRCISFLGKYGVAMIAASPTLILREDLKISNRNNSGGRGGGGGGPEQKNNFGRELNFMGGRHL